jgi:sigma-B regulation protein RsbU (phosphoserine phosphatase)
VSNHGSELTSEGQALEAFYEALLDDDATKLYERAPCGYLSTTPDGLIIKVNQTFLTLTGYQRDDLIGRRTFADLLTGGGRIYHETHYAPMLQMQGTARAIALDIVRADGHSLPVLVNSVLERDAFGTPTVIRAAVFDATERRGYERELMLAKQRAEASEARATLLARTLQQTLIPPAPPQIPLLDLDAVYRPAGDGQEVGGDFYDVFEIGQGEWVVAIGDVCGKGVEAAVITALARYTLRGAMVSRPAPSEALAALNDVLLRHGSDRFCTVGLLRLSHNDDGWTATVAVAGHPLPYLIAQDTTTRTVGLPGSALGVITNPVLHDTMVALRPEQSLVMYTDGVTEARCGAEFFGEDRFEVALSRHAASATTLSHAVLADVLDFQSGIARDDIALVAVRVPPEGHERIRDAHAAAR